MFLILTYHRIVANPAEVRGFFDVTADELNAHLQQARQTWSRGASPDELLQEAGAPPGELRRLLVTFDDGTADHYSAAAPVLERNGLRGVFFVSTSLLGKDGNLTIDQCRDLQARGLPAA